MMGLIQMLALVHNGKVKVPEALAGTVAVNLALALAKVAEEHGISGDALDILQDLVDEASDG